MFSKAELHITIQIKCRLTHAVFPITAVSLWARSTKKRAYRVVTAHPRETRLWDTLVYILSACTPWQHMKQQTLWGNTESISINKQIFKIINLLRRVIIRQICKLFASFGLVLHLGSFFIINKAVPSFFWWKLVSLLQAFKNFTQIELHLTTQITH